MAYPRQLRGNPELSGTTVGLLYGLAQVSEGFPWIPLYNWLLTPESQWQPRGNWRILQGCKRSLQRYMPWIYAMESVCSLRTYGYKE